MIAFIQAALEATTAFTATNIDDLFILMMFFSPLDPSPRPWQVVCGQFLGIAILVAVSLLALVGRIALPEGLIGLLGLFPISLGLSQLGESFMASTSESEVTTNKESAFSGGVIVGIIGVASLTIANGSDNISVYMAMLANSDSFRIRVILFMFGVLTGLWCLLAWWLTQTPILAQPLRRFRRDLAPLLLLGIGGLVLIDSHTFQHTPLALVALLCLGVMVTSLMRQLRLRLSTGRLAGISQP